MTTRSRPVLTLSLAMMSGCDPKHQQPADRRGERVFEARGLVCEIAPSRRTAVIRDENIPGSMSKMDMELTVRETNHLAGINVGAEITFWLHATEDTHWIDTVRRILAARPEAGAPIALDASKQALELKPGDEVPDQELLSEFGGRIGLSDFRGRAPVLTFFFTRCPLPDYRPRMNRDFGPARGLLLQRPSAPPNRQFLCVSLDAEFDKPTVLGGYVRQFDGNEWTRQQLADAVEKAAAQGIAR